MQETGKKKRSSALPRVHETAHTEEGEASSACSVDNGGCQRDADLAPSVGGVGGASIYARDVGGTVVAINAPGGGDHTARVLDRLLSQAAPPTSTASPSVPVHNICTAASSGSTATTQVSILPSDSGDMPESKKRNKLIRDEQRVDERYWRPSYVGPGACLVGQELKTLKKHISDGEASKKVAYIVVTGVGGVGKSALVKNYAFETKKKKYRRYKKYIVYLRGKNLNEDIKGLAFHLGVGGHTKSVATLSQAGVKELAHEIYNLLNNLVRVLLIIDGVKRLSDEIRELLPSEEHNKFTCLITSRSGCNFGKEWKKLQVDVLEACASQELFENTLNEAVKGELAGDVSQSVITEQDGLPLALSQAALYLNKGYEHYDSIDELVHDLRQNPYALANFEKPSDYHHTLLTTWLIELTEPTNQVVFLFFCVVLDELLEITREKAEQYPKYPGDRGDVHTDLVKLSQWSLVFFFKNPCRVKLLQPVKLMVKYWLESGIPEGHKELSSEMHDKLETLRGDYNRSSGGTLSLPPPAPELSTNKYHRVLTEERGAIREVSERGTHVTEDGSLKLKMT